MPQHIITPIERWRDGNDLVCPTGIAYDSNAAPAVINGDRTLGPALAFGKDNAKRIGVTVVCGLQKQAEDLGEPGEFEKLVQQAHIFGDSTYGLPLREESMGYGHRVREAVRTAALAKAGGIKPFNTLDWRGMASTETLNTVQRLQLAVNAKEVALRVRASVLGIEDIPEKDLIDLSVGEIHVTNHLNWLVVANACDQAFLWNQRSGARESSQVHIVLDDDPHGMDIARKFGALGINAELQLIRSENWPEGLMGEVLDEASIMTTGQIDITN